ncbi:GSCOCG00001360001-RA-CDS [Cotesia congregata]|uniref:Similar to TANGO6: Transport and Golgi organization protein 6 homolog (Homo sapiens) n=1 Tax=Cotesia congregata TaxID=51543 RepID=A0A8J2MN41_COTCN|nr:GSCOCG00001360001-RA-CDS [Cotesia congregata]CAG5097139.1 Similar to TANGO6: Transport and Golgi organization protein 6 homolog (Homo sapiens) [Cotesia congregata]
MDYHKILNILVTKTDELKDIDEKLTHILTKVSELLPENIKLDLAVEKQKSLDHSPRREYLSTILCILRTLNTEVLSKSKTYMSVREYRGVKAAIEMSISLGILPCLLPGIGVGLTKLSRNAPKLPPESLTSCQKYERLDLTTRTLTCCYEEISLRPAILAHLGPVVGALCQLAFAPLVKPSEDNSSLMTKEQYSKFSADQGEFKVLLKNLIDNCPTSLMMKELMVLSGLEKAPNWLKKTTRLFLIDLIQLPNGVMSLINATCENFDLGLHWQKLDTISRLVVNSSTDPKYFDSICKQFLRILASKNIKHAAVIANALISTLHEVHPEICAEKIIKVLISTLSVTKEDLKDKTDLEVVKTESQVEECIENLVKCFVPQSKCKYLPVELIKSISLPLFYLHVEIHTSPLLLKSKVRQLLVQLLKDETLTEDLFKLFLHSGEPSLFYRLGSNGGVEIVSKKNKELKLEEKAEKIGDSLLDLVRPDEELSTILLNYLLNWLTNQTNQASKRNDYLRNEEDLIDDICKQLIAEKLLISLASVQGVQRGLVKAPLPLLNFVKALFTDSSNYELIYASLMLVKVILDERPEDWSPFEELVSFLQKKKDQFSGSGLEELIGELSKLVRLRGKAPRFQDLNVNKKENFDKALQDLADPLLPVRAHGLMTLTKLIETSDPQAMDRKDLVLCLFRKNLEDEDSFVYLTAINGLCAMAMKFPRDVVEILVQEFVDMAGRDIAAENRAKLGEILVKTTKGLGDMAPAYKNILINGFLCGVRDKDSMVRASSLSCLGELCRVLGFKLGHAVTEVLYCVGKIIETDREQECRRAGVLVINLLIRGLGKDVLTDLGSDLLPVYRALKFLRDNDNDQVLRLHAQLALEELDDIVREFLYAKPLLQKNIYLIS